MSGQVQEATFIDLLGMTHVQAMKAMPKKLLCSVFDGEIVAQNDKGIFCIPACDPGVSYVTCEVSPCHTRVDHGEGKYTCLPIPSDIIAKDLAKPGGGLWERGVFCPAGDKPTRQELEAARERLREFQIEAIEQADSQFSYSKDTRAIDANAKRAAVSLGLKREWASGTALQNNEECPQCKELIRPGAAKCRFCGAILDAKAAALYTEKPPTPPKG